MRARLEDVKGSSWHPELREAGLCKVLAQEAGSEAAALPFLGSGQPKHAYCQGAQPAWGNGFSLGAGGCPPDTPTRGPLHSSGVGPGLFTSVRYFQEPQLPPGRCT